MRAEAKDDAALATQRGRESWPCSVSSARVQRSVAGWREAMSFPTVLQHTCLVCGRKQFNAETKLVEVNDVQTVELIANVIKKHGPYNELPGLEIADIRLFSQLPLAAAAATTEDGKEFAVCFDCMRTIEHSKLPVMALANRLWRGPIPPQLIGLTIPEKLLICAVRVKIYIFKLKAPAGPGTEQHAMKGQTIAFPQNVPAIFNALPAPLATLPDALKVPLLSFTDGQHVLR